MHTATASLSERTSRQASGEGWVRVGQAEPVYCATPLATRAVSARLDLSRRRNRSPEHPDRRVWAAITRPTRETTTLATGPAHARARKSRRLSALAVGEYATTRPRACGAAICRHESSG